MKDKAGGGGRGTIFLRVCLGMGIAVGTSSFAVDWCWVTHQASCRGIRLSERGGEGGCRTSLKIP